MAAPAALAYQYTNQTFIESLLSAEGLSLRLDDNADGVVSSDDLAFLTTQAINISTARVNRFCMGRYDASMLVNSWEVWDWTTIVAVRWLCARRGNPVPASLMELYDEALESMREVQAGQSQLADIGTRVESWPTYSNVTIDQTYWVRKVRVQRPLSEGSTPSNYRQKVDRFSGAVYEPNAL